MLEVRNFTNTLARAEAFVRAKCEHFSTEGLSIHIKYTRARGRDLNGYYRLADHHIVIAVQVAADGFAGEFSASSVKPAAWAGFNWVRGGPC